MWWKPWSLLACQQWRRLNFGFLIISELERMIFLYRQIREALNIPRTFSSAAPRRMYSEYPCLSSLSVKEYNILQPFSSLSKHQLVLIKQSLAAYWCWLEGGIGKNKLGKQWSRHHFIMLSFSSSGNRSSTRNLQKSRWNLWHWWQILIPLIFDQ